MSFILDQLKKSGRQRALEMTMRRQTEQSGAKADEPLLARSVDAAPVSAKTWHIAVIGVLLGAAVLYGAVVVYRSTTSTQRPVVSAAKGSIQEAAQLPAPLPLFSPSVQNPQAHLQTGPGPAAENDAAAIKMVEAVKSVKPVAAVKKDRNAPEKAVSDSTTAAKGKRALSPPIDAPGIIEYSGSVLEFKQLPPAVRKSLPDIRVTSHLYRKDSRLVSINGRIMSEGYNMDDGLYLEEITPEGVILSYGKHRFFVRPER